MTRISEASLPGCRQELRPIPYARTASPKVVHIGVGAFHRAHQAWYFDRLNEIAPEDPWLILGASLRSRSSAEQLNPQDGLYCHIARSAGCSEARLIQSLIGVINAFEDPGSLVRAIGSPETSLVTLTITENGYCLTSDNRSLDLRDSNVRSDLACLEHPKTAIGFLVAGLWCRYEQDARKPLTILSCDNLPQNGVLTRDAVIAMAAHHSESLALWIQEYVSFPSSMVDRIAPAVTDSDRGEVKELLDLEDHGLAITESFSQWVIEDCFAGARPALEVVGADFVNNVEAWEERKLRLLNAAHTALACLAGRTGSTFVHEAIAETGLASFVNALWADALDTLDYDESFDAAAYCSSLLERFANPHLQHRLQQIATDTSQKLPQRIIEPLGERLESGKDAIPMTTVVATWMQWAWGVDLSGTELGFMDPMRETLREAVRGQGRNSRIAFDRIVQAYGSLASLGIRYPEWRDQQLFPAFCEAALAYETGVDGGL